MLTHHGKTAYVSEMNEMIEMFIKRPPKGVDSAGRLSIEAKLADIKIAVRDLMQDADSPDVQDMLKAYLDQVKELTQGQA